jgi:hypothetical protein
MGVKLGISLSKSAEKPGEKCARNISKNSEKIREIFNSKIRNQMEFKQDICIQHEKGVVPIFQPSVKCLVLVQFSSSKGQTGFMNKYEWDIRLHHRKVRPYNGRAIA